MDGRMKILLAYDGSGSSDTALDDLERAGLPGDVEAVVLSVADVWLPPGEGDGESAPNDWVSDLVRDSRARSEEALAEAREMATRAAVRVGALFPGWTVRAEAIADSPAWGLVKRAEAWGADLVVVGSRDRSALDRLALGSVSQKVVVEAPCSVRIAREPVGESGSPARIVVGVDGSADSERAAGSAAARKWPAGSALRLITVVDSRIATALASPKHPAFQWARPTDKDGDAWVRRMNETFMERMGERGLSVSFLAKAGDPKRTLVEEAERWGADSIFIGATSLAKTERFPLGRVSSAVASRAHCSVEVVRAKRNAAPAGP
jgi:nucleotide-binding universal stress UspA family protein